MKIINYLLKNKLYVYTIISGVIASSGLLSNSIAAVIASMIVSPLLNPVTDHFASNKKKPDNTIMLNIMLSMLILVFIIFITGFIFGVLNNFTNIFYKESQRMIDIADFNIKNKYSKFITETFIAICVGIGIPISILLGESNVLVAFGIAPSITPPIANSGIYLANYLFNTNTEFLSKSFMSIGLGVLHIVIISSLSMFIMYKKVRKNK